MINYAATFPTPPGVNKFATLQTGTGTDYVHVHTWYTYFLYITRHRSLYPEEIVSGADSRNFAGTVASMGCVYSRPDIPGVGSPRIEGTSFHCYIAKKTGGEKSFKDPRIIGQLVGLSCEGP